jgi:uncharacterized membrane protein
MLKNENFIGVKMITEEKQTQIFVYIFFNGFVTTFISLYDNSTV